jgi:predicted HicB family RNase H-like nuclease
MAEKQILIRIPPELHRELKTLAARSETTMRDLIEEAIRRLLQHRRSA